MYGTGRGAPPDYVQAHLWLSLAAQRFPASETEDREAAIRNRDRVAARMTAAQIAEAEPARPSMEAEMTGPLPLAVPLAWPVVAGASDRTTTKPRRSSCSVVREQTELTLDDPIPTAPAMGA